MVVQCSQQPVIQITHEPPHGKILTETAYGACCDLCRAHLGNFETVERADLELADHLEKQHGYIIAA